MPTSTAAKPTKLCSTATSSGMAVIATRDASSAPMPAPIAIAAASKPKLETWPSAVMATASSMPTMPKALPRRAVVCVLSPPKLRMNSTPATRYEIVMRLAEISMCLPLEHLQHALSHQKASGDVDGRDQHRDGRQDDDGRGYRTRDL